MSVRNLNLLTAYTAASFIYFMSEELYNNNKRFINRITVPTLYIYANKHNYEIK